jgi:hypothetical protein
LEESLAFTLSYKGQWISGRNLSVMYNPDWCDQGRGVTAYAHAIRRIFDIDDIHGYLLLGIKRDSALQIIRESASGKQDKAMKYLSDGTNANGTSITLEQLEGAGIWDVKMGQGKYTVPPVGNPRAESQDYIESILVGAYQGIEWPYEYSRISKEARGANIRVTVEKINHSVRKAYNTIKKSAVRACGYALGCAVESGELPPGEWWAMDFPKPPEMTADKYREFQEAREEYKLGTTSLQLVLAQRGQDFEDLREQRDEDMDDLLTRCKALQKKHPELTLAEIISLYQQRSPNPQSQQPQAEDDDESDADEPKTKTKTSKPKGN